MTNGAIVACVLTADNVDRRFARDRTSPEVETRIERDLASGERSGVLGTPTFYVNGIRHDGGYDLDSLRPAIVATMGRISKAH